MKLQYHPCSCTWLFSVCTSKCLLRFLDSRAPEVFNRSRNLEFLYFLPFVAWTAVILKSRSSRLPCTAKQPLTIKCPNICHHSDTNPVWDLPLSLSWFSHCYRSCAFPLMFFQFTFFIWPTAPEGHWCAFCTDSEIILMTIMRRSFLLIFKYKFRLWKN